MLRALRAVAALALAIIGCGGGGDQPAKYHNACSPGPTLGDLPCDVGTVLHDKCQPCHQSPPLSGAKFPLLTYEDTQQPFGTTGKLRWQRMAEVIEPGSVPHMPYRSSKYPNTPQLTDSELQTLRDWFKACAPPVPEKQGCDVGE